MTTSSKVMLALIAGAAAGVVIGLLIAPEKGSDSRENISDAAKKFTDELLDKAEDFLDEINSAVKK